MINPLDPTIKENWHYHDEYEFWYMPYLGTEQAQAEDGVRWRGFKPWEQAKILMRELVCRHPDDIDYVDGWPDNICADRHEVSKKWVLQYLTDEQAEKCKVALQQIEGGK